MMTREEEKKLEFLIETASSAEIGNFIYKHSVCAYTAEDHSASIMFHLIDSDTDGKIKTFYDMSPGYRGGKMPGDDITKDYAKKLLTDKLDLDDPFCPYPDNTSDC
ncbi:hypothetical protein VB715_18660 [Crocosphaera sp. UHCC 0190]|uniref:hypothetical protein n=1 Tax=Crocosphaera sp. UHCC 0190 TaxID=3110246 RepID=UPI002B21118A|nr:hypothetical protein [Crocosphaera sp. UHCC 0190]MEA5511798.1 hypothetical protein [Crocosphaera sp. UHCC 0190]